MAMKQLTLPGELVKKSNEFVRSRLKLENATAGKIFTSIIACIRPEDKDFKDYEIPASALFRPEDKGGRSYALVRKALKSITGYVVEIDLSDEPEPDYVMYPLFTKASYKNGIVTAQVHPDLKPHFINLAGQFTQYNLLDYLVLSSIYSQRLFEILNSYEKTCPAKKLTLAELHFMLNTPDSLKQDFAQFRRRVLEPAHKEIIQKTRLEYEWKPIKNGRSIEAIQFIFSKKALEEKEKEEQQKRVMQQRKYIKPALDCAKLTKPDFVDGKCPKEKKKIYKCRLCKEMGYFLV